MITVTIDGIDHVVAKLNGIRGVAWAERPLKQSALLLENALKNMPPPIPGSRYVRTGTLQRKWTTEPPRIGANIASIKVGNNTTYAPWVQSQRFQARIHRNRWITDRGALDANMPRIQRYFRTAINDAVRGR